ncbi:MAG: S8 family serine peptidase, partial [Atopobiaceae bacterium]|nr:S8 family serine peptidase [Atopobiaceae bacterium]
MKERRPKNRNLLVALLVVVACVVVVGAWQLMGRPTAGSTSASTQATTEQAATDDSTEAADQSSEAASTGDSAPVIVDDGTGDGNVVGVDDDADAAATVVDEDYQQRVDDAQAADEAAGSGTSFEAGKALVSLADGVTVDQVNAMLATMDGVTTKTVTADDISSGYLLVDVAPTSSVEAATAELEESDVVAGAQPNYLYQVMDEQIGTASDLTAATSPTTAIEPLAEAEATSDTTTTTAEKDTAADAATTDAPTTDAPTTDAPTTDTATTDAATEAAATDEAAKTSAQTAAEAASTAATASATTGAEALEATVQAVTINDPYASRQWALSSTKVYQAWATSKANHQVAVAVIDTGALTTHEDLADNIVATYNSYPGGSDATDDYGHGTHVAGIVSAETNNGIGTSGTSYNADLVIVKASNSSGGFTSDSLVRAYQWLIANRSTYDIKVINMSLGGGGTPTSDQDLMKQIDAAEADGILTVCAAGNQAVSQGLYVPYEEWPGDYESVLSVINLQSGTPPTRSSSSNYNVAGTTKDSDCTKDVSAPGTSYYSTYYSSTSTYTYMSGTSMASPCVAGIAALLFAENDSLTPTQAMGTLEATATDLGEAGWDEEYGYGEVDADAAVQSSVIISGDDGVLLGSTLALGASTTKGTPTSWSWSSDDTAVASVGSTGVVTGSRAGTANITATATLSDGSTVSGTRSVTVIDASITGVSLVGKGSSTTYAVSSTPSGLAWSYSSSDPGVAAIGAASGVLTASTVGTVTITATSVAHPTVKLTKQVAVVDASISGAATVTKGGAASYSVTGASGHAWTWSVTSLGGTATIDSSTGRLVAGSTGKVKVTATSTENGSYALTKTVTVFTASVAGSSTVRAGSTTSLSVSATPSVGSWSWSTSDSSIATIDSSGTLTGVS